MRNHLWVWALLLAAFSLAASGQDWKAKQYADWTDDDAKQVLSDSPWAKSTTPTLVVPVTAVTPGSTTATVLKPKRKRKGAFAGNAQPAAVTTTADAVPAAGQPPATPPADDASKDKDAAKDKSKDTNKDKKDAAPPLPKLAVRWESAQPLREAERKANSAAVQAPYPALSPNDVDPNHYVVAVFGIPGSMITPSADSNPKKAKAKAKARIRKLKKLAVIKSAGRQDLHPLSVAIKVQGDSAVMVYSFSKKDEIIWREHKLSFEAQIENWKVLQTFNTDDMTLHGNLEL